jgi:hypothetical protein
MLIRSTKIDWGAKPTRLSLKALLEANYPEGDPSVLFANKFILWASWTNHDGAREEIFAVNTQLAFTASIWATPVMWWVFGSWFERAVGLTGDQVTPGLVSVIAAGLIALSFFLTVVVHHWGGLVVNRFATTTGAKTRKSETLRSLILLWWAVRHTRPLLAIQTYWFIPWLWFSRDSNLDRQVTAPIIKGFSLLAELDSERAASGWNRHEPSFGVVSH